jgi:hypothetical protein
MRELEWEELGRGGTHLCAPPVRAPQSSTAVKAKASAPRPRYRTARAALTRRASEPPSPHRKGTRSRRCGRQLTGRASQRGGYAHARQQEEVGTVPAAPTDWSQAMQDHPGPSRTIQDHPGPSRTIQDHPGPSRAVEGGRGRSRAVEGQEAVEKEKRAP